uniref:Regulatory protein zeste n=1 Tax=Anopheles farauti TaxID=69004 RepID=A0A182Q4W3_9DIPT
MELLNSDAKPKSASNVQKEELVLIFEEYQQKAKLETLDDSKERQKFWSEATQRLNKIEGGTVKSCSKWVKYWADVLINLRRKCRLVVEGRSKRIGPTPFEVRILRVGNLYDVLEQWTKAVENGSEMGSSLQSVEEEYYPEDTGVQKEEIVVENYTEDHLDEEFVASFAKPVEEATAPQTVTHQLHIRKHSSDDFKPLVNNATQAQYVELTSVTSALHSETSEFLRPKTQNVTLAQPQQARLKESLKRTTEKLETVMKKRKIDDSQFAIAQALTNMSAAILALSNSLNDLAQALTNGTMSS